MRDSDEERPDLYKKEAEIFMDVSVLIGKPLGALRPSPPITAGEEVNTQTRTLARLRHGPCMVRRPQRGLLPGCVPVISSLASPATRGEDASLRLSRLR